MATKASKNFQEEISTIDASKKYNLTASYVARLARRNVIRARKFGRDWIIDEAALKIYITQPHKPGPKPRTQQ
jgi:excisionase family DNA binding protein